MSFSKLAGLASVIALASKATAHGTVSGIVADGVYYVGYSANYQYMATQPVVVGWSTPEDTDNGFVAPSAYADPDIICHKGATNAQTSATVAAGGTVELQWTTWPESHHGPMIDYLASCNGDCTTVDKTTLEFFKIDGVGLVDDTTIPGTWGSDQMIANNNTWAVTIPSDIAPGNYVLRHETIALHSAGQADGAQNYPQCFNLEVTGSGTAAPAGTLGTALYTSTDAGILVNIYQTITDYVVPGPALYSGAGTAAQTGATSAISSATSSVAPEATGAPATTEAAATSVTTSAPVISTGAPFGNGTTVAAPQGTGSVSKSLCSKKTKTASATLNPTSLAVQAAATPSPVIESLATSVTIATTSSAVATSTASSSPSTSTPSTEAPSTVTEPEGTTLGDLLSWISSFYSTHKDTEYTGSTVARRHARDVVARKVDEEVFQYREY